MSNKDYKEDPMSDDDDENSDIHGSLFMVQQYLYENGYKDALKALERESGSKFRPKSIPIGRQMETMVLEYNEERLAKEFSETHLDDQQTTEFLLEGGEENYPKKLHKNLDKVHIGNIIAVEFAPFTDTKVIATGSADKTVKVVDAESGEVKQTFDCFKSPIIALDWNPNPELSNLLLASGMDGTHSVLDTATGKVIQQFQDHSKYVVSVKWMADGLGFATGSHDHSVGIYRQNAPLDSEKPYSKIDKIPFSTNPESIVCTRNNKLIMSVRDNNYLYYVDLNTNDKGRFNMNATGDEHVSFSAMHIQLHPTDDDFVLVNTDRDRMILYKMNNSTPVRNFWGASNDLYSTPRCAWHSSGKYVYSTSQDYKVVCWDVASQTVVSKLEGHKNVVRDLSFHQKENVLASCSFDKTVKLWSV